MYKIIKSTYHIVIYIFIIFDYAFADTLKCNYKKNICDKLDKVVGIKTPMMIASGTIINENIIVTNRHVVEDHKQEFECKNIHDRKRSVCPAVRFKFCRGEISV